jgi:hypothetical protein
MKKILIIAAGALLFGASAAFAQDTTRQTQPTTNPTGIRTDDRSADENMLGWSEVNDADIPDAMRTTLSSPLYQGWEKGTVHRNDKNKGYRIRIVNDDGIAYVYHFDKNGKAKDPDR